jgi:DNA-binding transcriptional ArsR family regulator
LGVQIVQFGAGAPCPGDGDGVFKALADPTRRALLDRFRERSGQTLGELCEPLEMAGQSATQHLGVLEAANLITTVGRDREKLHYLNPVPLRAILERWIGKFERLRLRALSATSMARGRRTDEVVLVVLKGVRSACDICGERSSKALQESLTRTGHARLTGISVQVNPLLILWVEPDVARANRS